MVAVENEMNPEGITAPIQIHPTTPSISEKEKEAYNEQGQDIEVSSGQLDEADYDDAAKIYVPDDNEEVIDPRLKDYPILLVAKTVDLHNDFE